MVCWRTLGTQFLVYLLGFCLCEVRAFSSAHADEVVRGNSVSAEVSARGVATSTAPGLTSGLWEKFAQGTYERFYQSCDSGSPAPNAADEDNDYLTRMAQVRVRTLDCVHDQINSALHQPAVVESLTRDFSEKLAALIDLRHEADAHDDSLAYKSQLGQASDPNSAYYAEVKEKNRSLAKAEAILASMPFIQTPRMQEFVRAQLQLFNEGRGPRPAFEDIQKSVASVSGLASTLNGAVADLHKESVDLHEGIDSHGKSLSLSLRESLAQDRAVVEEVLASSDAAAGPIKSAACRIDAKYGRGARARDNVLVAGQVGMTVVTGGLAGAARLLSSTALAEVRGAVTLGQISARSANILGRVALVTTIPLGLVQTVKACKSEHLTGTSGPNCSNFSVQELKQGNCTLNAALVVLGGLTSTERGRSFLKWLTEPEFKAGKSVVSQTLDPVNVVPLTHPGQNRLSQELRRGIVKKVPPLPAGVSPRVEEARRLLEEKLGFTPTLTQSEVPNMVPPRTSLTAWDPKTGDELGEVAYNLSSDGSNLNLIWTESQIKDVGLNPYLTSEMLARNPAIKKVSTAFQDDNATKMREALAGGASCEEAVRATVAYRAMLAHGFTKILLQPWSCREQSGGYHGIEFTRP